MDRYQFCKTLLLMTNIVAMILGVVMIFIGCISKQPHGYFTNSYVGAQMATVGCFYALLGALGYCAVYYNRKDLLLSFLHFTGSLLLLRALDYLFWLVQGMYPLYLYQYLLAAWEIMVSFSGIVLYSENHSNPHPAHV